MPSSSAAGRRSEETLSKELQHPITSPGTFEDIPRIPKVADEPTKPRMQGLVAIITGANSPLGIGRASAHLFAASGCKAIYLCDLNPEHLDTHKRELNTLYPSTEITTRTLDAADEDAVSALCDDALSKHGRLDVMFANAGIASYRAFPHVSAADFMEIVRVDLLSVFLCAKHASRCMRTTSPGKPFSRGAIVATASSAGMRSNAGPSDYSAAKAGVISLAQTMAYQLAGTGIRMNALCPGIIETGMTQLTYEYARSRGTLSKIGQLNPLKRGGVADEVARVALFLASEEASYVNGQAWAVDGGLSAGHPFVMGKLA
ncbi:MAG: hypothetical protein M1828_004673 [Chrysothrix sp. TS-e1954]|nr:MAG: hypothetical protein M1828_004673 [Chrysothrix sp. TS-e1954]